MVWKKRSEGRILSRTEKQTVLQLSQASVGYIDDNLVAGERVVYRAHLHWKIYIPASLVLLASALLGTGLYSAQVDQWLILAVLAVGALPLAALAAIWLRSHFSEFAVTDKRVLIKTGIIKRHTLETLLSKVENISVEQGLWGRLLNYGTIRVTGTGATQETFTDIAAPLEFRKQIQGATIRYDEGRTVARQPSGEGASESREERECPFCAERILAKATVCRFCGRDVSSATGG